MARTIAILVMAMLWSSSAYGFVSSLWKYLKQYQLGIEYSQSFDRVQLAYETDLNLSNDDSCETIEAIIECRLDLLAGHSSGYGIFLQQAFKRRSNFHFAYDLSFGLRYLAGGTDNKQTEELMAAGLPMYQASFSLVTLIALPYIQVGYTPASRFPDILLSIGPAFQTAIGSVRINEESKDVVVAMSSGLVGYVEIELVLWRFGKGAFSLYAARDKAGAESTPFYPDNFEHIKDIHAEFQRGTGGQLNGFGAKLLLNWP